MILKPLDATALKETVDVLERHSGNRGLACKELGITESGLRHRLKLAARKGHAPGHFNSGTAPGFFIKNATIHRVGNEVKQVWERQHADMEQMLAAVDHVVAGMVKRIPPAKHIRRPAEFLDDLLTLYTFTDYHLGMLAWHREGGSDWNLKIAEETGVAAMDDMVSRSPRSKRAILNIQGDFFHTDGLLPMTPTSGNILDADSRFGKMVDVAISLICTLVDRALRHHDEVTLLICEGNHDIISSLWLRKLFKHFYRNNPRVSVEDSDLPYYAYQWGQTMLGFHHGHLRKNDDLPALFSAQFRAMWGQCPKVYIHTGHRHHKDIKAHTGAEVVQHPTMAARDAHAARGGWWSERQMLTYVYHKTLGEIGSHTTTPEMLDLKLAA